MLVVHRGARHGYALPAAFAAAGMLEAFLTDMCAGRGLGRIAEWARPLPLPGTAGALRDRLAARRPPGVVLARTRTADLSALAHELRRRLGAAGPGAEPWRGARHLGRATHLFTVFGEGGGLVEAARARGLPVLSDIVIAPSTPAIVRREHAAHPGWGPLPPYATRRRADGLTEAEWTLRTTDVFVCPSRFVAEDLVRNRGVAPGRTHVVPYALPPGWSGAVAAPVPGRVLFVGTAELRKGIHVLAEAADALRARGRGYEFRVAGDAAEAVRGHPAARALTFLGRIPRAAIREEFARADVFVLPTLAEGSATVTYEALATGLPVVTTAAAGSQVRDGIDGTIVPARDPEALAAAIEAIVEDRPRRGAMSRAARENGARWTWDAYGRALTALVAATPPGGAA